MILKTYQILKKLFKNLLGQKNSEDKILVKLILRFTNGKRLKKE